MTWRILLRLILMIEVNKQGFDIILELASVIRYIPLPILVSSKFQILTRLAREKSYTGCFPPITQ